MEEPLITDLGVIIKDDMIEKILDGNYKPTQCDHYTKSLIDNLQRPANIVHANPVKDDIDLEVHIIG